jgi:hypothetical protein
MFSQRSQDSSNLLQRQELPKTHSPQSDSIQNWQGIRICSGISLLAMAWLKRVNDDTTENRVVMVVKPNLSFTRRSKCPWISADLGKNYKESRIAFGMQWMQISSSVAVEAMQAFRIRWWEEDEGCCTCLLEYYTLTCIKGSNLWIQTNINYHHPPLTGSSLWREYCIAK